ncbi:TPA: hypothetical protein QDA93_002571 [Burkholderia vietnamiensis]|nr:hypothetical protein [Burkholderia vietnamiensis]
MNITDKSCANTLTTRSLRAALAELVERCDGQAGVRADGSNIDTSAAHAVLATSPIEQPEKSLAPEGGSEARGRWIQANCPTGDIIESPSPSNNREFPTSISENDCEHRIALAPSQPAAAPIPMLLFCSSAKRIGGLLPVFLAAQSNGDDSGGARND